MKRIQNIDNTNLIKILLEFLTNRKKSFLNISKDIIKITLYSWQFYMNISNIFPFHHLKLVTSGNIIACHNKLFNLEQPGDHPSAVEVTRK